MSELQSLTDRLGEQVSRSVAIDDPEMRLQSYSPHYGAVDEQRLASILHRQANPEAIEWAGLHDVRSATGWVRVPANPERGMLSRVCVPIRFGDQLLGYLWLIDQDESMTSADLALATLRPPTTRPRSCTATRSAPTCNVRANASCSAI